MSKALSTNATQASTFGNAGPSEDPVASEAHVKFLSFKHPFEHAPIRTAKGSEFASMAEQLGVPVVIQDTDLIERTIGVNRGAAKFTEDFRQNQRIINATREPAVRRNNITGNTKKAIF